MDDERISNNERVIKAFLYGCFTVVYFAGAIAHVNTIADSPFEVISVDFELVLILFGGFTWLVRIIGLLEMDWKC